MKTRFGAVRAGSITITAFWLGCFAILPQVGLIVMTFLTHDPNNFVLPEFTLANYSRIFTPNFIEVLYDSVKISFYGTLLCFLISYPFAAAMASASPRLKPWLMLLIIIPFWTNSLIRTYALIIILKTNGIISMLLEALHITNEPVSFMYGDLAVFIGIVYTFIPFMVLPIYSSMEKLDHRLIEAAQDLGASRFQVFRHITFPLVMPGVVTGVILVFLPSLGAFYIPEILGGAKSLFIGNFIKDQFLVTRDWTLGGTASVVLTLLMFVLIIWHSITLRRVGANTSKSGMTGGGF